MILAGDIGKEECHLAIYPQERNATGPFAKEKIDNKSYSCLEDMIDTFLKKYKPPEAIYVACFGIAGPVISGECEVPKLGWRVTVANLRKSLDCDVVSLLNDMVATGYAIPNLSPQHLVDLNPHASPKEGNQAVILGTGSGLGEMLLYWDRDTFRPSSSEGGHANFAPRNDEEIDFLRYLREKSSQVVSWEQVISWAGLKTMYMFLRDKKRMKESIEVKNLIGQYDLEGAHSDEDRRYEAIRKQASIIVEKADRDELCKQALNMFMSVYGAEAGDLALRTLAVNSVYVSGSIALKILDKLKDSNGPFMKAFADKEGQFAGQNRAIPVKVICDPEVILVGATRQARIMASLE